MNDVEIALCVFCEVDTGYEEDKWGIWCYNCHRALRIKWI